MKKWMLVLWAVFITVYAAGLTVLHFSNPYPLVQIPDKGHRLFSFPNQEVHDLFVGVLNESGLRPYGTFQAGGINQTLLEDGITVLAYGGTIKKPAISVPVSDPVGMATTMSLSLSLRGMGSEIFIPGPEIQNKLVVLELSWSPVDIVYRLQGRDMGNPHWIKKY